jgi:hypothetical protein
MDLNFFLFFFVVIPFALMNITAYRKERKKADQELQALLQENNSLLRELLAATKSS